MNSGFNLIAAAEAHVLWRTRLWRHVHENEQDDSLDVAPLGQDGICQLGVWISGPVLKHYCDPEIYQQLSETHCKFHQLGASIVASIKAGDRDRAEAILKNEYSQALHRIIQLLSKINRCLHAEHNVEQVWQG